MSQPRKKNLIISASSIHKTLLGDLGTPPPPPRPQGFPDVGQTCAPAGLVYLLFILQSSASA